MNYTQVLHENAFAIAYYFEQSKTMKIQLKKPEIAQHY